MASYAPATKSTTFQLSVLRCRVTGRELFLEAGKDFVDTLFSFLLLPVGTIIHMLSSADVHVQGLGGMSSLFESMKQLDRSFLHVDKQYLLQPRPAVPDACRSIGLIRGLNAAKQKIPDFILPGNYYRCNSNSCANLSSTEGTPCAACLARCRINYTFSGQVMTVLPEDLEKIKNEIVEKLNVDPVEVGACSAGQGFVRENITYLVTDQLEVMPSTTIRSIKVLNKLKVATLSDLESSDVHVNINQILQLLHSAMTSSTCLNDVFGKK